MPRKFDTETGLKEAAHIQKHHEEEMQRMFRDNNIRNMLTIMEAGFNQGYDACLADVKKMSVEAFLAMKGGDRG